MALYSRWKWSFYIVLNVNFVLKAVLCIRLIGCAELIVLVMQSCEIVPNAAKNMLLCIVLILNVVMWKKMEMQYYRLLYWKFR